MNTDFSRIKGSSSVKSVEISEFVAKNRFFVNVMPNFYRIHKSIVPILATIIFLLFPFSILAQNADTAKFVLGKIEYAQHAVFVKIPESYANKSDMYLRKEALDAFILMQKKAKVDGISLIIISACRNFNHQKSIWEAKWNGARKVGGKDLSQAIPNGAERAKEILKYSSMPGTSRHHWGTDIDINSLSPSYFESGKGKKEYEWLRDNASEFGFCQVYSKKGADRKYGYEEEKWHWSYTPIASQFTQYFKKNMSAKDISGFAGSDALPFSEVLKYVDGIAGDCR
ncbi:MAG: M15 family metallopeptidase [Flavobacteriales bacterium]|nr:M15 family metallopeptidase [Flavobacteriales bacterium]